MTTTHTPHIAAAATLAAPCAWRSRLASLQRRLALLALGAVTTLSSLFIAVAPHPATAAVIGNDYPLTLSLVPKDALVDPWGFYNRECTSFVAWRVNSQDRVTFRNLEFGVQWGNAENWGPTAVRLGLVVDHTPTVGAVAWDAGGVGGASSEGHVAWVANVEANGTIDVEEYNYTHAGQYDVRAGLNPASFSGFIHFGSPPQNGPITLPSLVNPGNHGYWLVGSDGGIFAFGMAQFHGSTGSLKLQSPVAGMVPTPDRGGYWLVASDGGVFAFGDAGYFGSVPGLGLGPPGNTRGLHLNAPVVGMVPTSDGGGYFLVASDGGVFAFGDAAYEGSCPAVGGCQGVQAVLPDASGKGYWVVTKAGGVYIFGDAKYFGPVPNHNVPVVGAARTPDGGGYWVALKDGTVYTFGNATYFGGAATFLTPADPASAIFATNDGGGYWITTADGAVYGFGDALNLGGLTATLLNGAIIGANGF